MSQLDVALLGTPTVRHGDNVLHFPTRKALALLVYLLVQKDWQARDKLTAFFFPESDEEHGRAALRRTIAYVRATLSDDEHLLVERDALRVNPNSDLRLDVDAVENAAEATRTSDSRDALVPLVERAVENYRGDFLEGFALSDAPDFDAWTSVQREYWHRRIELVFDRLSQFQAEGGELGRAVDTAARWVAHDALNEEAYRRLMQLELAAGNMSAARQTYETCRAMLAAEFNAEPSPETEALASRIRTNVASQRAARPKARVEKPASLEAPLVGRINQFAKLVESYHAAANGMTRVVLVEGEAGIGKTRLANDFVNWAAAEGADVMQGRGLEMGGRLPYQPLVDALRQRLAHEADARVLLGDIWLGELSRLLPHCATVIPSLRRQQSKRQPRARACLKRSCAWDKRSRKNRVLYT